MEFEKYSPNTISVSAILGNIMSKDIVIPEIQRPFVWKKNTSTRLDGFTLQRIPNWISYYLA